MRTPAGIEALKWNRSLGALLREGSRTSPALVSGVPSARELEWMNRVIGEPQEGKDPREGGPALQVEIVP
jgi:hypothetical protein